MKEKIKSQTIIDKLPSTEAIVSPELEFKKEKFIKDLRKGFKVTRTSPENILSSVKVVSRIGDELFEVEIEFRYRPKPSEYDKELVMITGTIRRKKGIPSLERGNKDTATLEIFKINYSSGFWFSEQDKDDISSFRVQPKVGGALDEKDFFKLYNSSVVDLRLTKELFEYDRVGLEKYYRGHRDISLEFEEKLNASDLNDFQENPKNLLSKK